MDIIRTEEHFFTKNIAFSIILCYNDPGDYMKTMTYSSFNFDVEHERLEKDEPKHYNLHAHAYFEICCFLEGEATYHIEGNEYPILPGDIILLRPGEAHLVQSPDHAPFERIVLSFGQMFMKTIDPDQSLYAPFFNREAGQKNLYHPADFPELKLQELFLSFSTGMDRVQVLKTFLDILQGLNSAFCRIQEHSQGAESLESRIVRLLSDDYHLTLSLQELADRFYISRAHLCRRFKKATGISIGKFVTEKRLTAARELLLKGRKASDVCVMCGFRDYSTFYRAYTRYFGHSPHSENKTHVE